MIIVGAMALNRVIGSGDGLPWDVPEEYDHFLRLIEGKTIIIGRRSYQIFGDDLSSAHNVVVSRSVGAIPGAVVVPSIEEALRAAASFGGTFFSAGGARIYKQTIPLADTMYLSFIKGYFAGDTYFPEFAEQEWTLERRDDHPRFEFVVYRRTGAASGRASQPRDGVPDGIRFRASDRLADLATPQDTDFRQQARSYGPEIFRPLRSE